MLEIETISCSVCGNSEHEVISTKGRDFIKTSVAICTSCGFLYQNPRWSKEEILKYYETKYDSYYRSNFTVNMMTPEVYDAYPYGFHPVYQRIRGYVNPSKELSIVDVGSGEGTNLLYLGKKFNSKKLKAIEPSIEGKKALEEKQIKLIDSDVDADWHKHFQNDFDIVTLRHVFEHLHFPNEFLQKIKQCLTTDGILYIAVPDAYNIGTEKLESEFFRIVHNYYFTRISLRNILIKNGFEILELSEGDKFHNSELFVIAKPSDIQVCTLDSGEYERQLSYLNPILVRERTLSGLLKARTGYWRRRLYNLKVQIKTTLGLHKWG